MTSVMTTNQMIHRMVDSILETHWQVLSPPNELTISRKRREDSITKKKPAACRLSVAKPG